MIKKEYRLEDYIITEYDPFMYTWEMNMVLGEHRIGNCFMVGNILIFEPWSHEKEGCLKLEFYERLRRLLVWNKSRYYCFSSSLRDVATGQNLSNRFNLKQVPVTIESGNISEPGIFRLSRYKIIVEENGTVSWQIYEALNKIYSGPCITESGILFIGSKQHDVHESQSKKQWVTKIRSLPEWDKTFAWGHWNILHDCSQEKEIKKSGSFNWNQDSKKTLIPENMQSSKKQDDRRVRMTERLSSNLDRIKKSYPADGWKDLWGRFSPWFINCLRLGVHIFLCFLKKTVFWVCQIKDYFLKHSKK